MSHDHHHNHASPEADSVRDGIPWGLLLGLIGAVAICWLGATGRLNLYIHPRYNLFTVVMAALAALAAVAAWAIRGRSTAGGRGWAAGAAAVAMVVALLIVPPATLTSASAQQRSSNSGTDTDTTRLAGADPSTFKLRDWAVLVGDPDSVAKYSGQQVKLTGFVTPTDDKRDGMFYLGRFVVTCCTVDARPVVVPIVTADWAKSYKPDHWLEVTGRLMPVENAPGGAVLVVQPSDIKSIPTPDIPYEY
ncbi:MAG: TIGR03943 family protein [Micropruina sp.]|uniref:TIGR03943 family putative permease subunit n=1 Tax=Micropruina sp. TaxID=2737536 RepID=UPI0039E67790